LDAAKHIALARGIDKARKRREDAVVRRDDDMLACAAAWRGILADWKTHVPVDDPERLSARIKRLYRAGIPPSVRPAVWRQAFGNKLHIRTELFQACLERALIAERVISAELAASQSQSQSHASPPAPVPPPVAQPVTASLTASSLSAPDASGADLSPLPLPAPAPPPLGGRERSIRYIVNDIPRTLPDLQLFAPGAPHSGALHDVLRAFSVFRLDVGYVQGISLVAALAVLHTDSSAAAFALTANIAALPMLSAALTFERGSFAPYEELFSSLLEELNPSLTARIAAECPPGAFLAQWVLALFVRALPFDTVCHAVDAIAFEGDGGVMTTAIALVLALEKPILAAENVAAVLTRPREYAVSISALAAAQQAIGRSQRMRIRAVTAQLALQQEL
jgi:hypothetical protein